MKELNGKSSEGFYSELDLIKYQIDISAINPEYVRTQFMNLLQNGQELQIWPEIGWKASSGEHVTMRLIKEHALREKHPERLNYKDFQAVQIGSYIF